MVVVAGEPSRMDVLRDYAKLGIKHIATGLDHLLFVFGLLLLTGGTRLLLATITAFTIGHSVTLALAALEIIKVPQAPIEVVIAVTIYVLAVELARDVAPQSTLLRRRPWAMAFSFGLLHGLGFAGALREAGLPANDVPLALLSFNVGIEIGQVAFVSIVLAATAMLRTALATAAPWAYRVPVYAMGIASSYWILVRATAL
jgi:hydrogenase/urease accessory protein HupE